jgi:uncharacterized protein YggE
MIHPAFILALSALPLGLVAAPALAADGPPPRQITVTGVGEASAKPDIAVTALTVLRTGETARAALDEANKAMAEVVDAMKALKIESRDLQTSGFSINPQYRYDQKPDGSQAPPVLIGYEVRNTLTVRIRDIAAVGGLLDRAVTLGVNQGGDITFTILDPKPVRTAARRDAVADATETAKTLAEAAGVTLGPVVSINADDDAAPPQPMPMARMALAAPPMDKSVPVEAGENTVRATVRMVFEIGAPSGN